MMLQNNGSLCVKNVAIGFQQIMITIAMAEPGSRRNVLRNEDFISSAFNG